jgi:tetratricopeptide (TPR) repeat protein
MVCNISACTKATTLHTLENCNIEVENHIVTGELLNDLFKCKRSVEAFNIIKKNENNFTTQDYAVTGDILLIHNYIDESIYYLDVASKQGDAEAMQRLGAIYAYVYKYKDLNKSLNLLLKSIAHDYYYSFITLADIYFEDRNYKDNEQAEFYAKKAIENNYNEGYYYLAMIQAENKKYLESKINLKKLSKYGLDDLSNLGLAQIYYLYNDYDKYNPKKSKEILEKLVKTSKSPDRFRWMADFYMGDHQYKNKEKAKKYYEKAFDNGDLLSEEILMEWKK